MVEAKKKYQRKGEHLLTIKLDMWNRLVKGAASKPCVRIGDWARYLLDQALQKEGF